MKRKQEDRAFWVQSIGTRFTLTAFLIIFGISLIFIILAMPLAFQREVERLNRHLTQVQESHIPSLVSSLWLTDYATLQQQLEAIVRFPYIDRVEIVDIEGKTYSAGKKHTAELERTEELLVYSHRGHEVETGTLILCVNQGALRKQAFRDQILPLAALLITAFMVSVAIFLLFRFQVGIHLEKLSTQVKGDDMSMLASPLQLQRRGSYRDELSLLVDSINRMRGMLHDDIQQRETIIREAHHRIKNDMTFIQSILRLQASQSSAPEVARALEEAGERISVVIRLYEGLYRNEDFNRIEVQALAERVTADLRELGHLPPDTIRIKADAITLPAKLAMAVGIILNELVINAIKHAASGNQNFFIDVVLEWNSREKQVELEVKDKGSGFPQKVLRGEEQGFGLVVVAAMVKQHKGSLNLFNEPGARVCISLPCD